MILAVWAISDTLEQTALMRIGMSGISFANRTPRRRATLMLGAIFGKFPPPESYPSKVPTGMDSFGASSLTSKKTS